MLAKAPLPGLEKYSPFPLPWRSHAKGVWFKTEETWILRNMEQKDQVDPPELMSDSDGSKKPTPVHSAAGQSSEATTTVVAISSGRLQAFSPSHLQPDAAYWSTRQFSPWKYLAFAWAILNYFVSPLNAALEAGNTVFLRPCMLSLSVVSDSWP